MDKHTQKAHGILDLIVAIGDITEKQLDNADNEKEYTYIFGHLHLCAVLSSALTSDDKRVQLSFDYDTAHKAYLNAKKSACKESKEHQISMEELYPEIFKAVDAYLEKKEKPKKSTKDKE